MIKNSPQTIFLHSSITVKNDFLRNTESRTSQINGGFILSTLPDSSTPTAVLGSISQWGPIIGTATFFPHITFMLQSCSRILLLSLHSVLSFGLTACSVGRNSFIFCIHYREYFVFTMGKKEKNSKLGS